MDQEFPPFENITLANSTDTQHEIDRLTFAATGFDPRPGRAEREREEALKNAR
jgi:hypothetical protein